MPVPSIPARDGFNQTGSSYGGETPYNRFGGSYGGSSGYGSYGSYGYSSPYTSSYGSSSMYSPYGGHGGYAGGMYGNRLGGGYGGPQEGYSRFLQQAEENSRPAFQSIESIVQAFASVSMMLESTFTTVHNCFRAVLGVADHFSRLKVNMARILSALAIFRFLRYVYHRLLEMLRLRQSGYAEDLWKEAAEGALAVPGGIQSPGGTHPSPSWPIFMFFAVVVGGPYVIWRLLCSEDATQGIPEWASGEEDHVMARAEYDFASDRPDEVSFKAGDLLNLAPKELQPNVRGWLLASVDGTKVGLVPGNYIKVQGRRKGRKYTTPPGAERQIVPSPSTTGFQQPPVMESMGSQVSETDLASSWNEWAGDKKSEKGPENGLDQASKEGEKAT